MFWRSEPSRSAAARGFGEDGSRQPTLNHRRLGAPARIGGIAAVIAVAAVTAVAGHPPGAQAAPPRAQAPPPAANSASADQCAKLAATTKAGLPVTNFETLEGAPTFITAATVVPSSGSAPEICRVEGFVTPSDTFIIQLPITGWNGKLFANGSHGNGGQFYLDECAPALASSYATVANSLGHVNPGKEPEAGFAYNNPQAGVDFGYRATHVTTVAAKAIVEAFYGSAPTRSYFSGCSTGARQALVEAERYPDDFNGIIAGPGPIYASALYGIDGLYTDLINRDAAGHTVLTTDKLPLLAKGALDACDGNDGLKDGIITDPQTCHFDPGTLRCPATGPTGANCLSAAQVDVARKFYDSARDSQGRVIYPGGNEPGSELSWGLRINDAAQASFEGNIAVQFDRYLGFPNDPGPSWNENDFNLDRDPARLGALSSLFTASNPDLSAFRAHGGKLIMWSGWSDQAMPPRGTTKFYKAVADHNGGLASTLDFARLFMVPAEYHCRGGTGPTVENSAFLTSLDAWVGNGTAPDKVVATQQGDNGKTVRTRPLYPYPKVSAYNGQGSPDDANSFHAVEGSFTVPGDSALQYTEREPGAGSGQVSQVPTGGAATGGGSTAVAEHIGEFTLGGLALIVAVGAGVIAARSRRREQR